MKKNNINNNSITGLLSDVLGGKKKYDVSTFMRNIRIKLKRAGMLLEYEQDNYTVIDEDGYLKCKGDLEYIDHYCIVNSIYNPQDCFSSIPYELNI